MRRMFGFLIGIFVGWLVGSTVALLLTPTTGARLRSEIRQRGMSFMGEIKGAAESRRLELEHHLQDLRTSK